MERKDSFGVHFVLRRMKSGKNYIYARVVVNGTISEVGAKQEIAANSWNYDRGCAKPKTDELKRINSYLEEMRGKRVRHYQQLRLGDEVISADMVKQAFLNYNKPEEQHSLIWLIDYYNKIMKSVLAQGTMKNYYTTASYLQLFIKKHYDTNDVLLRKLTFEFITGFEHYVRTQPLKEHDQCTNNGAMKHMERLKKIMKWAKDNEWVDKNPFELYKLKFKHKERDFLSLEELRAIENKEFENEMLRQVKELFLFSCYTGLAFADLLSLKPENIFTANDGMNWIRTSRAKTGTSVYVPLLKQAISILNIYNKDAEYIFPSTTNQNINRGLKIISEICEIKKHLTFHLARHTFATTITLMNGVPIESISKMLGHTKLSTTMIYAKLTQPKVAMDMAMLQQKMNENE